MCLKFFFWYLVKEIDYLCRYVCGEFFDNVVIWWFCDVIFCVLNIAFNCEN